MTAIETSLVAEAQEVVDRDVKLAAGRHAADLEFPHALSP